ncbi:MAG: hypothetical protein ABSC32_17050 [Steroidobacteraceae bacterium]|jgi:hypothetical protein
MKTPAAAALSIMLVSALLRHAVLQVLTRAGREASRGGKFAARRPPILQV